jgi:hypothetical protein
VPHRNSHENHGFELVVEKNFDVILALANFLEKGGIDFRWQLVDLHSARFYFKKAEAKALALSHLQTL